MDFGDLKKREMLFRIFSFAKNVFEKCPVFGTFQIIIIIDCFTRSFCSRVEIVFIFYVSEKK